jgi:hypothetical protein
VSHADIHILGSRIGYTTLASSPGVSDVERRELEVLSFGDATNAELMSRLESEASMVGRRLRSGRFAISRMIPGGTDDAGRPTIEVVTLLLDRTGYAASVGALHRLVGDIRFWRLARSAVNRGCDVPEENPSGSPADGDVLRAFDLWAAARARGAIAVVESDSQRSLLTMISLLDSADLAECRWGIGVLSLSAPVDICTLAPSTAPFGPRPVLRAGADSGWMSEGMQSAVRHVGDQPFLPPSASLASQAYIEPALDRPARAVRDASTYADPASERASGTNLTVVAALTATASVLLLLVMVVVYRVTGRTGGLTVVVATPTETAPAPSVDATSTPNGSEEAPPIASGGYDGIMPIAPPAPVIADADGDGVPDDQDPCPQQAHLVRIDFYLDADGDGYGAGLPEQFCVVAEQTVYERDGQKYVRNDEDQCPDHRALKELKDWYYDEDGDGMGAGSPDQACEKEAPANGVVARWVATDGDECPQNANRQKAEPCGCDWEFGDADEDFDGTLDCIEDDDGDGILNRDDRSDLRRTTLDEILGDPQGISVALAALQKADRDLKGVEDDLVAAKRGSDPEEKSRRVAQLERGLASPRGDIDAAIRMIYEARLKANFGTANFTIRPTNAGNPVPAVLEVAGPDEFEVLYSTMDLAARVSARYVRLSNQIRPRERMTQDSFRDEVQKYLEENFFRGSWNKNVGDWALSFMTANEKSVDSERKRIERQIGEAQPRKRGPGGGRR